MADLKRHPLSWLRSRWSFALMSGYFTQSKHRPSAARHWLNTCMDENYGSFISRVLERYPGICTQTHFRMLGQWTGQRVDAIGRVEDLPGP